VDGEVSSLLGLFELVYGERLDTGSMFTEFELQRNGVEEFGLLGEALSQDADYLFGRTFPKRELPARGFPAGRRRTMTRKLIPVRSCRGEERIRERGPTYGWGMLGSEWDQWFHHQMEESGLTLGRGATALALTMPAFGVDERDDYILIRACAPGADPEDLRVLLIDDRLAISGRIRKESGSGDGTRNERYVESFRRSLGLPKTVDPEEATAEYADGVLTVTLPKRHEAGERS
jgi:HSP20 family molecular chaperone IbpA